MNLFSEGRELHSKDMDFHANTMRSVNIHKDPLSKQIIKVFLVIKNIYIYKKLFIYIFFVSLFVLLF